MEKKAHIEVDLFGFDFVFPEMKPFDFGRFLSSVSSLLYCFRFHPAEAEFFLSCIW